MPNYQEHSKSFKKKNILVQPQECPTLSIQYIDEEFIGTSSLEPDRLYIKTWL